MEGPWPLGPRAYRRAGGAECLCARDSEHRAAASHSHQALQVLLCSMRRRQLACAPARAYEAGLCESGEALWEHRSAAPGCAAGNAAPAPGWSAPKRRRARAVGDQHQSSGRPRSAPAGVPLQPLGSPRTRPTATAGERADLWPPDRCGVRQRAGQGSAAAEPWRKAPRLEGEDGRGAGRRGGRGQQARARGGHRRGLDAQPRCAGRAGGSGATGAAATCAARSSKLRARTPAAARATAIKRGRAAVVRWDRRPAPLHKRL